MQSPQYEHITTAIDYPNAAPHVGHALEKVLADVMVRFLRARGTVTHFTMGLDENSQHIVAAAEANGADTYAWLNSMDQSFRSAWHALDVTPDSWIRTTTSAHSEAAQELFRRAQTSGSIYRGVYSGWYCPNCNSYYDASELVDGKCPDHPSVTVQWIDEENYFFRLSQFGDVLRDHIERNPEFITPVIARQEVLKLLDEGLRDFSVSRFVRNIDQQWGIPVPGDKQHVLYVWFDALTSYLTALGFPDDKRNVEQWWPNTTHIIGKNIVRFHCVYWPAMLLAAGVGLPKQIVVHGFLRLNGARLSKSTGNVVDPVTVVEAVGSDAVRYYLMRNVQLDDDSEFSWRGLQETYAVELCNDFGNLVQRVAVMVSKYRGGVVNEGGLWGQRGHSLRIDADLTAEQITKALTEYKVNNALSVWRSLIRRTNQYIEEMKPWVVARQEEAAELDEILGSLVEAVRLAAILIAPVMPRSSATVLRQWGTPPLQAGDWDVLTKWGGAKVERITGGHVLFPRLEEMAASELP